MLQVYRKRDCMLLYEKTSNLQSLDNIREFSKIIEEIKKTGNPNQTIDGDPVLVVACELGDTSIVAELLRLGADVLVTRNSRYAKGNTPLIEAARYGHLEIVKLLLKFDVKINAVNFMGISALSYAVLNRHLNVVKYLLNMGADIEIKDKNNDTPLLLACAQGFKEIVEYLLSCGANVNHTDLDKEDAFILASKHNDIKLMEILKNAQK